MESGGPTDPEQWLELHGDSLFRYAMLRVRRSETAADLVQETLLSALGGPSRFEGRSSERTWLIGILRNKISDYFRQCAREAAMLGTVENAADATAEALFRADGRWRATPERWSRDPADSLERAEFWLTLWACLDGLPENLAGPFILRELEGMAPEEVCQVFGITATNLWARLHRARLRLRGCLERRWFGTKRGGESGSE